MATSALPHLRKKGLPFYLPITFSIGPCRVFNLSHIRAPDRFYFLLDRDQLVRNRQGSNVYRLGQQQVKKLIKLNLNLKYPFLMQFYTMADNNRQLQ